MSYIVTFGPAKAPRHERQYAGPFVGKESAQAWAKSMALQGSYVEVRELLDPMDVLYADCPVDAPAAIVADTDHEPYDRDAQTAFNEAIKSGRLSDMVTAYNFAGNYMFMGRFHGKDCFKHRLTRKYLSDV